MNQHHNQIYGKQLSLKKIFDGTLTWQFWAPRDNKLFELATKKKTLWKTWNRRVAFGANENVILCAQNNDGKLAKVWSKKVATAFLAYWKGYITSTTASALPTMCTQIVVHFTLQHYYHVYKIAIKDFFCVNAGRARLYVGVPLCLSLLQC